MATSTITEPGFIVFSMSRVTSFGAAAPGTSTVPISRSARRTSSSIAERVENTVEIEVPNWLARRFSASAERSTTVTCAPMPTAIVAAWVPDTPPPRITTSAAGTPGTPPSSTPRPPCAFSSACAPTCGASRPATSDIGVSSGSEPFAAVTVS